MWDSETESVGGRDYGNGVLSTSKPGVKTDGFEQRGQSWYVATDIPSDLLIQIGDVSFHLHKYPLLSRSGKMNRIIYDPREPDPNRIILDDLPGGPASFELAAKFCYGIAVDLTAANISGLRCAAEYLEMTEDLEEGNLIFKTEAFLSYVVLSSWRDSIIVLKSCEPLSPWAENLQIVRRCSESIAWKACANPKGIRWQYTGRASSSPRWNNEAKDSGHSASPGRAAVPPDWWFEDVSILRIDHFVRVVTAIKVKGMRHDLIGAAITYYAGKWLSGQVAEDGGSSGGGGWKGGLHMIVSGVKEESLPAASSLQKAMNSNPSILTFDFDSFHFTENLCMTCVQAKDQRMIVESLISIIPPQKDSVSCSFLLRLLRTANMLKVAPALVTELEKRVGMQFEQAALADLLIPTYGKTETMYDVDLVQRLLEHFLVHEQSEDSSPSQQQQQLLSDDGAHRAVVGNPNAKARVARLVDSYLTEVSRDRNLSLTKFQVLAESLPDSARTCDDGLYRAVDSYLKKLSMDACMHAAQNERLPLRVVVQVIFSEQVKISNALATSSLKEPSGGGPHHYQPLVPSRRTLLEGTPQSFQEGWAAAKKDINTLKFELDGVKSKYAELQGEVEALQRQLDRAAIKPKQSSSAWTSGWKKLSRLAKTNDVGPTQHQESGGPNDVARKGPRRWRNSIS
ncbi:phototropic-responsive NPH3 family protein [Striga asiatica]|uniref:Phototropic-responsive NPH3 family protein n=1 Tax=Striga asiatica TaxID=4170 RepID=A0A5A7RCY8_STRAF|nr:phototropic-responsive NPH3 family protein [Striga asiatica]